MAFVRKLRVRIQFQRGDQPVWDAPRFFFQSPANLAANVFYTAVSRTFPTLPSFTCCLACQRSWSYCMASQLSGERSSALERRSAISGLMRLVPVRMRFSVDAATPSFSPISRPLSVGLQIGLDHELAGMGRIVHSHRWPRISLRGGAFSC